MNKKFMRATAGLVMCSMIAVGGLGVAKVNTVKAATDASSFMKIDSTNYNKTKTPKASGSISSDYIFAGWYSEASDDADIKDDETVSGEQYAKFISDKVLSVMCQNKDNGNGRSSVRFVTTVDNLKYQKVGFKIWFGGANTSDERKIDAPTTNVYKKIVAKEGGVPFTYEPTKFDSTSAYFATATVTGIPSSAYSEGIYVKPYIVTLDGSTVYGVPRYVRVDDATNNIINVPVRLSTEESVAAGKIEVTYDKSKYEYQGGETGDLGEMFGEMYVNDNNAGKVTCVGNANPIGNKDADGLFVNLRFKALTEDPENYTFGIAGEEFANYDQNSVTISVSDYSYTNPNK